jgi:hypothetical protein
VGTCGEEGFRCLGQKKAKIPAKKSGILQAKKAGYSLIMEGFWLGDKFRIRAVTSNFLIAGFCAEIS